jgi:DNA repair exonuclease SbcCD ATPase subunit
VRKGEIVMLRGVAQRELKRRLTANRALSATMSFLALIGWGAFAYSAGASARAERQLRDELAQSKAAQDQLLAERSQQRLAAGDLAQIQATLAAARGELETLAQRREQTTAQVAAAQQELTALAKRLEDRRAKVSEKGSVRGATLSSKPARVAARSKHDA